MAKVITHREGLAFVPLGKRGEKGVAIVDEDDLTMLESLGLSLKWNRHYRTGMVHAPAGRASGSNVLVARVLMDCGPGQNVTYRNGDPTDLRRANLAMVDGNATRRDRDYVTPLKDRKAWGPDIEHEYA